MLLPLLPSTASHRGKFNVAIGTNCGNESAENKFVIIFDSKTFLKEKCF